MSLPLVSCIMPTRNRREFVPKAIEYFLRQTYPNKQLVIGEDAGDPIPDDVLCVHGNVWAQICHKGLTLGAKRNVLVEACCDSLIAHWDDDDWYGPERLQLQVDAMQAQHADVCGLDSPLFYDLRTGKAYRYHCPIRPYLYSATLMYTREYWARSPFPDIQVASATPFVWGAGRLDHAAFLNGTGSGWYVGMAHDGNTSPKDWKCAEYFKPEADIATGLGADWPFYQGLRDRMGGAA